MFIIIIAFWDEPTRAAVSGYTQTAISVQLLVPGVKVATLVTTYMLDICCYIATVN